MIQLKCWKLLGGFFIEMVTLLPCFHLSTRLYLINHIHFKRLIHGSYHKFIFPCLCRQPSAIWMCTSVKASWIERILDSNIVGAYGIIDSKRQKWHRNRIHPHITISPANLSDLPSHFESSDHSPLQIIQLIVTESERGNKRLREKESRVR